MIISFGHKHGVPSRAKKVFDVRDLTHDMASADVTAKIKEIREYGAAHPGDTIGIGCEQGKHRSVVLANTVASLLRTSVYHRDK